MKAYKKHYIVLVLLWLLGPVSALGAVCDVDDDADIDRNDIMQIALARNTPATGPDDPRDGNGDGNISATDTRICALQCSLPGCAVIDPPVEVPTINVSPDPLDFGDVFVGSSASLPLVVENTGTATLSVSGVAGSGAPFTVIPPVIFDIAAGGLSRNVDIEFSPTAPGVFNGTITINSNADNINPVVIAVTGRGVEPQVNVPTINVSPDPLDFGDVFVGSSASRPLVVENTGTAILSVSDVAGSGAPFSVFPPVAFDIADGGSPRNVDIGFSPTAEGIFNGTITISSNADNTDPVLVAVTGRGVQPLPAAEPDIDSATTLPFGEVSEGASVERQLTISNLGDAPLNVSAVTSNNPDFAVAPLPGQSIPFTLDPGATQNVAVTFTAPTGSAGTTVAGTLTIISNDPDESPRAVSLTANVIPVVTLVNIPILGASIDGGIDTGNCVNVSGSVQFGTGTNNFLFGVSLTDQDGTSAASGLFTSMDGNKVSFSGIDACALDDGILQLKVNLGPFDPFVGTPAIKNSGVLPPPVLDPVAAASVAQSIQVCGTSRTDTTVKIEGGARTVSTQVTGGATAFCLDVPLRRNTENTLIATAIDNLAAPPKPRASASPIQVTHVDPSSIIIAEASSRPLTIEETQQLVDNGVIQLDDPSNFNVSMFTIVLTIGAFPVTVSQPVAVPTAPGVSYGSSGGSGWSGGGGGGGGGVVGSGGGGCVSSCSNIVVIKTPSGQVIPGVIIIDGRIKTLKEFFQVTIAIQNTSSDFDLTDMVANIVLPAGLSPVKAGPGTNVSTINTGSALDTVDIGLIQAGQTGTGQFIIRGDGIGTHNVDVDFNGFLEGGGLAQPEPVNGSASTSVQVFGPPTFDVTVRHPSRAGDNNDVLLNEIYDLIVEIENTSSRPALYTSLELFVGGQALLVDENDVPLPNSNQIVSFGTIPAGRAVQAAFRVQSLVQGEIIACQAIASENINLTVDTGPAGTECNIANTYPANFEPLPVDQPPVVIGINPLNGQPNIPVTTSILATLTPQSCNIVGDTFNNVVTALINPGNPSEGLQVISADLLQGGTFYLEELDTFGNPVRRIPTDLTVENPPAGGTTIAVLRLGLASPLTQFFLKPNTTYRATLVGGPGGIASCASNAEMLSGYSWTFSTEQVCSGIAAPIASMSQPPNGSTNRPLNQSIVLNFTNRMNPGSFGFVPGNLAASSLSVYAGAIDIGGEIDISTATAVPGSGVFSNLNRTLTYTPIGNLAEDTQVFVRLTDGLRDICGNPLQTPPSGVQLLSFQTIPPDTVAPLAPVVNPVPAFTNLLSVQVSGQAEAGSTVTVTGGSVVKTTTATAAGLFSVSVPLNLNAINDFSIQATDASSNASAIVSVDNVGNPLTTVHDNIRPVVSTVFPANGAIDVARNIVITADFNEDIKPTTINNLNFTLEGSVIPGTLAPVGNTGFSFTPDNLLDFNKTYNIRIRANGMRDLAGNGLSSAFVASFTTQNFPLPVVNDLTPNSGVQGTTFAVTFSGTDLATASAVISDNPGISGTVDTATDTSVTATITVDALAATGVTTLGLTTLGGSASVPFTVLHKAPTIAGIAPNSGDQGMTVAAQIQGAGLTDITSITIDGTGVIINDLGTGSDSVHDVELVIEPAAVPGARTITVTTPGGSDTGIFNVIEFIPAPVINSVTPDNAVQGSSLQVTFDGANLVTASGITSTNPGVSGNVVSATASTVIADITINSGAAIGGMQLGVTTAGGSVSTLFTITPAILPPTITGITPDNAVQGQTINATITGSGFSTLVGIGSNCAGLDVVDLGTGNDFVLNVEIQIDLAVPAGSCVITVNTLGGSAGVAFTVLDAPTAVTLTPNPAQILTRGSLAMTATLNAPAPTGGQVVNLAGDNSVVSIPPTVTIPGGAISNNFLVTADNTLGTTLVTAGATGFTSDSSPVEVVARDFTLASPLVGIDRTVTATLTLAQPAPVGGAVFDMSVDNSSIVTISPAQITIPAGQTAANFDLTGQFTIGTATVTADGTGNGYVSRDLVISVTDRLLDLPTAQDLYLGQLVELPLLIAPDAAGPGGVTIEVASSNPGVAQVLTPQVTIPEGSFQAVVQVLAASSVTGTTTITASNPAYAPDVTQISVSAGIEILQSFSQFEPAGSDEIVFKLTSGGGSFPSPVGGVNVNLTSSDDGCVSVPALVSMAAGSEYGSAILTYGGVAATPCSATVTVDAGLFGVDSINVSVEQVADIGSISVADIWWGDERLGSASQVTYRVTLSNSAHGGVTVQVTSSNPAVAMVSDNPAVAGAPVTELFIADGSTVADFYVQGTGSAVGNATITAREAQFSDGSEVAEVVPSVVRLSGLNANTTTLTGDDPFRVELGYIHSNGVTFRYANASAYAGDTLVDLSTSNASVANLATTTTEGLTASVLIPVNNRLSPSSLATGGVAARPQGPGSTTISATGVGLDPSYSGASGTVTVTQPVMTVTDIWWGDNRVGVGQQVTYRVSLGASQHGGVTVNVTSDNANALLSTDPTLPGSNAISLFIANGSTTADFYVQGLAEVSGITITATQPLFSGATAPLDIVPAVIQVLNLSGSNNTLGNDDPFRVRTGYIHANGTTFRYANVNPVAGTLDVDVAVDDIGVGELITNSGVGATATVQVPVIDNLSPNSVAAGGVALSPTGPGVVTVSASAPGYTTYIGSSVTVTMTAPTMSLADIWWGDERTGAGQQVTYRVTLGAAGHGGVTVDVSVDSADALLSTDPNSAGSNSVSLTIPDGQTTATLYVQGVNAGTTSTITASQALFGNATQTIEVVDPVVQLVSLSSTNNTLGNDDPFTARSGYIHSNGVTFRYANISPHAGTLTVTANSDNVSVGQLVTSTSTGDTVTVEIPVNDFQSPGNVAGGGMALDPTGEGNVNVSLTAPGYQTYSGSSQAVTISAPIMTVSDIWWGDERVGEGQQVTYRVTLGASQHGGVTVNLSVDSANVLLSSDPNAAGFGSITLFIPNGQTTANFYVQGLNAVSGATITASHPLFADDTEVVDVVPSVLQILSLAATTDVLDVDDPFLIRSGYIHANGTTFRYANVSPAAGPLSITVNSDNVAVGQLVRAASSGASVAVQIPVNQFQTAASVAAGGVAFDPLGEGSVEISATAAGYVSSALSSFNVTVTQPSMTLSDIWWGDARIGGGLQAPYRVTLGSSQHGGVTVRVASSDTIRLLLATDANAPGTSFIDLFIPNGSTTADFYVQGINGVTGNVTLTATTPLFPTATLGVELVQGVMEVVSLSATQSAAGADDPFAVRSGYVHSNGTTFRYAPVSAGDAPLQVLVTSSNVGAGEVQTLNENGASATVEIQANQFTSASTVATGGIAFDPIAAGDTVISTSVGGFDNSWPGSSFAITVGP